MLNVRLADFNICIENKYEYTEKLCNSYLHSGSPDLTVKVTEDDISREQSGQVTDRGYLESLAVYRRIAEWLPLHDAFLMHCVAVDVDGVGVTFLAKSGVGKTTHMTNWRRLLGDRLTVVNGDKPLIRKTDDGFYAYGTPWSGKEELNTNTKTPLKKLCFIERAEENECVRLEGDLLQRLLVQTYRPSDVQALFKTLDLLGELVKNAEFYLIKCNKEPISAKVAFETVFKNNNNQEGANQ